MNIKSIIPSAPSMKATEPTLLSSENSTPQTMIPPSKLIANKKEQKKIKQQLLADFLDLAERIIENLFSCSKQENIKENENLASLSDFGWMVIHRCQLSFANVLLAILYLIRLKQRHPSCKGGYGSGHRLFLAALIVANKYLYDDAYHNHTWAEVTQGIFKLDEINRMEFELIYFLNFTLNVSFSQWFELVDLLDHKLHTELVNVGCMDSKRYRLSYECGIRKDKIIKKKINEEMQLESEIESDNEDSKAILIKQKMNQHTIQDMGILSSPLQNQMLYLKKNTKPTPPAPKKMLHLPLHKSTTPPTPQTLLDSPINHNYIRQRRGSHLKYEINKESNNSPKLKTSEITTSPKSNKTKPLPILPKLNHQLNTTTSCINLNKSLQMNQPVGQSFQLLNQVNLFIHNNNQFHPRRKSLPAFPITTKATTTTSFKVNWEN